MGFFDKKGKDEVEKEDVYRIGKNTLNPKDLDIQVEYGGETFNLRYPLPFQRNLIESEIARRLEGLPRDSYPRAHIFMTEAFCYVDALAIREKCPKWFEGPAWGCLDEMLIIKLYEGYTTFRTKFIEGLQGNNPSEDSRG